LNLPDPAKPGYTVIQLPSDPVKAAAALTLLKTQFPVAADALAPFFYDANALMASVLDDLHKSGKLTWTDKGDGTGYLSRTEGSCHFCVNRHWHFPNECRYGKTKETPPPDGFLEKVAAEVVRTGRPPAMPPSASPPPPHPLTPTSGLSPLSPAN
jgi:hypothetical protein